MPTETPTHTKPTFAADRAAGLAHMGRYPDIGGHSPGEHPATCGRCAAEAKFIAEQAASAEPTLNEALAARGYRTEPSTIHGKKLYVEAATGRAVGNYSAHEGWAALRSGDLPDLTRAVAS